MNYKSRVSSLKFISDRYEEILSKLGILTVIDLIRFFPFRYTDSSEIKSIKSLFLEAEEGEDYNIQAKVTSIKSTYLRGGRTIQQAKLKDATGELTAIWFNQPYLANALKSGFEFLFRGRVKRSVRSIKFYPNLYDQVKEDRSSLHLGRITPEYSLTAGLTKKWLRNRIKELLDNSEALDLPDEVYKNKLSNIQINELLKIIHFPEDFESLERARDTLSLYEFANIQLKLKLRSIALKHTPPKIKKENLKKYEKEFKTLLEFELTTDQSNIIAELCTDLEKGTLINHLLQGDVGSGKTIIAIFLSFVFAKEGYETVVLCPTTILAKQHFKTFSTILAKAGISTEVVTSSKKSNEKAQVYLGTSAILARQEKLLGKVGAIVVDEQHRFGVRQREELFKPFEDLFDKFTPHFLNMSATPIPRTIAQVFFSDLKVLQINTKPLGRKPIKTFLVADKKRADSYKWIEERVESGDQVYWICPSIDDNSRTEMKSVKSTYEELKKVFGEKNVGLLHGKLKEQDKLDIMQDFAENKIKVLVSTTVIEVGIDVANANIIVVENSERFGLAQLHQIRGRVGRGSKQSWCFLFNGNDATESALERLEFLCNNTDGLKIAEFDLEKRGPGEIYGTIQSGVPNLKIASLKDFKKFIEPSKDLAEKLLNNGVKSIGIFDDYSNE